MSIFKEDLLAGKRILVTGGGTGLGRVMAEAYLQHGAQVVICGRRKGVLDEAVAELSESTGGDISAYQCDIKDYESVENMITTIWDDGPIDGLVNNAAGNFISRTEDLSPRAFNAIADIVMHGTFYVTNSCGKRWIAEGKKASVISIVVTWVFAGGPYVVPSSMSKAGVAAMTQSLAQEWGKHGIRLNAVAPGPFPTEGAWERLMPGKLEGISQEDNIPLRRVGRYHELANLALFLMADEVEYLTGEIIALDGGQWLNNKGTFSMFDALDDNDWKQIREQIQSANAADKAKRGGN